MVVTREDAVRDIIPVIRETAEGELQVAIFPNGENPIQLGSHVTRLSGSGEFEVGFFDVTHRRSRYELPEGAEWMSFDQFFRESPDMLTKAVLGQYLIEVRGCLKK